ncbi:glutaredoxin family protein [Desulfovibrio sp. OttesenSCG-928-G11]|nr:glutaredoxin family protein [Desulfovibrio sp. OttesenSCG-928-G11]
MAAHSVIFYGLSTCIHCRHAREFLEEHQIGFELHYVDQASGEERANLLTTVKAVNPNVSFPTIVVDGASVIVGFQPQVMARALEL